MPNLDAFLGNRSHRTISGAVRAVRAWQRILDRATSITVYRAGVVQTAQTVRIEFDSATPQERRQAGEASVRSLVLFGVKDHPDDTVPDTALLKGDRFAIGDDKYEIKDVIALLGEIQARAERIT